MRIRTFVQMTCACCVLVFFLGRGAAHASLAYYNDRAAFNAVFPGIPVEDFEEGRLIGAAGEIVNPPLSSTSANNVFHAGEILPGMVFQDNPGPDVPGGLFLSRTGFNALPSKTLSANDFPDSLDILFSQGAVAAALDLFAVDLVTRTFTYTPNVSVYGNSGLLGTRSLSAVTDGVPVFFGVTASEPITRLNIDSAQQIAEFVDNVGFAPVPEPSTCLLLACCAPLLAGLYFRRKR